MPLYVYRGRGTVYLGDELKQEGKRAYFYEKTTSLHLQGAHVCAIDCAVFHKHDGYEENREVDAEEVEGPDRQIFLMAGVKQMSNEELERRKRPDYVADDAADLDAGTRLGREVPVYREWLEQHHQQKTLWLEQHHQQKTLIAKQFSVAMLKAIAGAVRLLLEDILNVLVQAAMLANYWDSYSDFMKGFTIASMAAALFLSLLGPLKDCYAARKARKAAKLGGFDNELSLQVVLIAAPDEEAIYAPLAEGQEDPEPGSMLTTDEEAAAVRRRAQFRNVQGTLPNEPIIFKGGVLEFLENPTLPHSVAAHWLLVIATMLYWVGMGVIPFIFSTTIVGGKDAYVPPSALLYFNGICMISLLIELWVASHTKLGIHLIQFWGETLNRARIDSSKAMTVGAVVISAIGRYDTFCDVVMTVILCRGEPIEEIEFNGTLNTTIHFPVPLHEVSVFSLVVGVFGLQALPGIFLIIRKQYLAAAFKLNEFNFLLGMLECE